MVLENISVKSLTFRSFGYPITPTLGIIFNLLVILGMLIDPDQRMVVYSGIILIIFFVSVYQIWFKRHHINN